MTTHTKVSDGHKERVAEAVLNEVENGMLLGLGSGSTAQRFLLALGSRIGSGGLSKLRGVPTSRATERTAREVGIPLIDLPATGVDLAIDGMDEVDDAVNAIKGLGGAMLREKVVAASARRFVLIGASEKRVPRLGAKTPLPVEVLAFGVHRTSARVRELGLEPTLRGGESEPFLSDNGNPVLDCTLPEDLGPEALADSLRAIPGVLGHGLFLGMAQCAYLATDDGVDRIERPA